MGKLQAPQRRQKSVPFVEITRQYLDQLLTCVEKVKRRHQKVAQYRVIDPVNKPGQGVEAEPYLALVVARQLRARLPAIKTGLDHCRTESCTAHGHHDAA